MTPCERFAGPRPIALSDVTLPASLRVAVAAPHPDDFDVLAIAMRTLQANGNAISLAVLTTGVPGVDDGFGGADGHIDTAGDNRGAVREFLLRVRPDIVFLPHGQDSNVTHQRTHAIVTDIVAADRLSLMACLNEDPTTLGIRRMRADGLDGRTLSMNRSAAAVPGGAGSYAEVFELACYDRGVLVNQVVRSGPPGNDDLPPTV